MAVPARPKIMVEERILILFFGVVVLGKRVWVVGYY